MANLMLITIENCKNCDWVKERIPDGLDIEFLDGNTKEGMAQLSYYEKYDPDHIVMPIFIIEDEELAIEGTIKIKNKMLELVKNGK